MPKDEIWVSELESGKGGRRLASDVENPQTVLAKEVKLASFNCE